MDIANSEDINRSSTQYSNCYKVASLDETILNATQVSNLKDQYILGEQLGWGQFGIIRACKDKFTGEVLACKSITKDRLVTHDDVCSVKLEIEIMARLSGHPNVVNLKAVYEEESYVHLLMELCAGGELFHRLEKHGRFFEHDARVIFRHLMQVVKFCHENAVVHRDLKPENILLATTSLSSPIKLADFGLATYCKPGQKLHGTVGSPFYIAPEVLTGGYDQAADIWSAGVILYILLSGMPPFWGKTKSRIFDAVRAADLRFPSDPWDTISALAKDLITGMLHVDTSKRLTAEEVLAHSWMEDITPLAQETYNHDGQTFHKLEVDGSSFSTPCIARPRDYSFSTGPSLIDGQLTQSPAFTCKSSFSSLLHDDGSPCSASGEFSFSSCHKSSAAEFSSPIQSMPSFTFSSPMTTTDQENVSLRFKANMSSVGITCGGTRFDMSDSSMEKIFVLPDSLRVKHYGEEMEWKEVRRGTVGFKGGGIHSRRHHTIGLGELNQFDLIVTESVIRWASCTDIPTAPSLRLSLVC